MLGEVTLVDSIHSILLGFVAVMVWNIYKRMVEK